MKFKKSFFQQPLVSHIVSIYAATCMLGTVLGFGEMNTRAWNRFFRSSAWWRVGTLPGVNKGH